MFGVGAVEYGRSGAERCSAGSDFRETHVPFTEIYLTRRNPSIAEEDWPRTWRSHAVFVGSLGLGGPIELMLYCARIYGADAPGLNTDYDGVALLRYAAREETIWDTPPEIQSQIDRDELRVFERNIPEVRVYTEQTEATGADPSDFVVLRFFGDDDEVTGARGSAVRFARNDVYGDRPEGYEFAAVTETWFESEDQALASIGAETARVTMLARVVHRWPR